MAQEETPVLIVGGSLVGLTSALLLGDLGVPSLVVERHPGTAIHARAGHFHLGTTEMLRQVGLERTVREASAKTYHPTGGIIAVESLAGEQLATYVKELNEGVEGFSPTVRVFINQDVLEPILREKAVELGATVRNRVEATALEQDDDGVTVTLRRPRVRQGAHRPRPLRDRRRRQPQSDADAARHRHEGPRDPVAQHHDLLPRRLHAAAGGPQPGRDVRPQPGAARLLPDRPRREVGLPRDQLGGRRRDHRRGRQCGRRHHRGARRGDAADGDRNAGHPCGDPPDRPLEGRGELRHTHARRARVPGRRRRPRRAAQRRLRRQHGDPGRAQPRLEARRGHPRRGRDGAPRHLRGRAPPALGADRRAGVHALRHPGRARSAAPTTRSRSSTT